MPITQGSATLMRYKVGGDLPPDFADFLDRRIRANLFLPIEDSTEEQAFGWCSIHDFMDTDFAFSSYALEPFVVLGLRVDRRKVPASTLKKYHRLEVKKALALRDGRGLSRSAREDLKEKVRLDLLRRTPPTTVVVQVVWDSSTGELWVATGTRGLLALFEDLFRRTFDLQPWPRIPYLLAGDLLGAPMASLLDSARPCDLCTLEVA